MLLFSSFPGPIGSLQGGGEPDASSFVCVYLYYFDWRDINYTPWFSSGIALGSRKTKLPGTDLRVDSDDIHQAKDTCWSIPEHLVETRVLPQVMAVRTYLFVSLACRMRLIQWSLRPPISCHEGLIHGTLSICPRTHCQERLLNNPCKEMRSGFPCTSLLCLPRWEIRKTIY